MGYSLLPMPRSLCFAHREANRCSTVLKKGGYMSYRLLCYKCGCEVSEFSLACSHCGSRNLFCEFDLTRRRDFYRDVIKQAESFWDYQPVLPVSNNHVVTIGEGSTPLVRMSALESKLGSGRLYVKNEGQNPTGSFKDRCMAVAYSKALQLQARATVLGSAGNAGAAAAAYSAKSGIPCFLFVPGNTALERIAQSIAYGAHVLMVDGGGVTECIDLINEIYLELGWMNVTTARQCNPFQGESEKTIAYEIVKALDYNAPDYVIVPIGGGGCLSGITKGFKELYDLGLLDKRPRMIGAEELGCAPLTEAFERKNAPDAIVRVKDPRGIASPIMDAFPIDGAAALEAIYETGGISVAVTSQKLREAQLLLSSKEGIFVEIASSTTIAVMQSLIERGVIGRQDTVVCVVTGNGLKDSSFVLDSVPRPNHITNTVAAVKQIISSENATVNRTST